MLRNRKALVGPAAQMSPTLERLIACASRASMEAVKSLYGS